MTKLKNAPSPSEPPQFDWYLREWMEQSAPPRRQSDLCKELGWSKDKANKMWHRQQRYNRDDLNAVAVWLNIRPHELLMPVSEAMALRGLRLEAERIVAIPATATTNRRESA